MIIGGREDGSAVLEFDNGSKKRLSPEQWKNLSDRIHLEKATAEMLEYERIRGEVREAWDKYQDPAGGQDTSRIQEVRNILQLN